ncbi:hypothetical protein Tco_1088002 [Tanacetum coccineum]
MAIMNSCNKHNMIACVEKTERNANFHEVIDFLTGCDVNYALLVSPDVAGKKILVLEASVRTDLMFNDEDGTNCFDNQSSMEILGSYLTSLSKLYEFFMGSIWDKYCICFGRTSYKSEVQLL